MKTRFSRRSRRRFSPVPISCFESSRIQPADDEDEIRPLDGYELASRLSYFLWSSMPDERLFELAEAGELTRRKCWRQKFDRMLADPKSRALVDNFAGQWLQLRDVSSVDARSGAVSRL